MKRYMIGTSGWNYGHWKGKFYPEGITKKGWFSYYAKSFDTVEMNASFYRWPKEETMQKWKNDAPAGFKYTMKAPRMITHLKKLKDVETYVKDFYSLTSILKDRLGCHLFQLPPNFKKNENNLRKLRTFLSILDARKDNVIEFRDPGWWDDETYKLLKTHKVGFCIVNGLGMPDDVVVTAKAAYFRFHGRDYSTEYSLKQIKRSAEKIRSLECKKVYAYFNNDADAYAVKNALQLRKELRS